MWPGLTASDLGNILKIMKSGLLFGVDVGHMEASGAENRALRGDGDESGQGAGTSGMCRVSPGRRREGCTLVGEQQSGPWGVRGLRAPAWSDHLPTAGQSPWTVSWPLWLQWGCVDGA